MITKELLNLILALLKNSLLKKRIASYLDISSSTINKYKKKYIKNIEQQVGEKPKSLNNYNLRLIKYKIIDRTYKTASDIYRSLKKKGMDLLVWTVRRALKDIGFKSQIKKKKPFISKKNKDARLKWKKEHKS